MDSVSDTVRLVADGPPHTRGTPRRRLVCALAVVFAVALVLGVVLVAVFVSRSQSTLYASKDVVFENVDGYTLDDSGFVMTFASFAVRDGRFVAVSKERSLSAAFPSFQVVDMRNRTVLPGLIDAHAHLFSLGEQRLRPNINDVSEMVAIRRVLEDWIAAMQGIREGDWVLGGRWSFDVGVPTSGDLDASPVLRRYRIALRRIDGHALWCNSLAMPTVIPPQDPEGGRIVRFPNGSATGVFVDTAQLLVKTPEPPLNDSERALAIALKECVSLGLTGVHTAGEPERLLRVLENALDAGTLSMRVYAMLTGEEESVAPREFCGSAYTDRGGYGRMAMRAVKLYADGSLGARGAWMLAPYSDAPNVTGLPKQSPEQLAEQVRFWANCGFQIATHAIGDKGNRVTLNAYAEWLQTTTSPNHVDARLRIEHAQIVSPEDFARFPDLGVIASMQPIHALSDMSFAEQRVGPERILGAYAWETFRRVGVSLVLLHVVSGVFLTPLLRRGWRLEVIFLWKIRVRGEELLQP